MNSNRRGFLQTLLAGMIVAPVVAETIAPSVIRPAADWVFQNFSVWDQVKLVSYPQEEEIETLCSGRVPDDSKFLITALRIGFGTDTVIEDVAALSEHTSVHLMLNDKPLIAGCRMVNVINAGMPLFQPLTVGSNDSFSVKLKSAGGWPKRESAVVVRLALDGMLGRRI